MIRCADGYACSKEAARLLPSHEFPGNWVFYISFFAAVAFFVYSVSVKVSVFAQGKGDWRFDKLGERLFSLIPYLVGNARVARLRYWYSGLLHTMIYWGFIVLQVRTLNFLLSVAYITLVLGSQMLILQWHALSGDRVPYFGTILSAVLVVNTALSAAALWGLVCVEQLMVAGLLMGLVGAGVGTLTPIAWGVLQEIAPGHMIGRVLAIYTTAAMIMAIVGMTAFGWITQTFGERVGVIGIGLVMLATAILAAALSHWIRVRDAAPRYVATTVATKAEAPRRRAADGTP